MLPSADGPWADVVAEVEPGGRVTASHDVTGGLSSAMTVLDVERADGGQLRLVVRRAAEGEPRGALSIADEFALLVRLHGAGLPVPTPRWLDAAGRVLGQPLCVLDHVEGAIRVTTDDPAATGRAFADHLAAVHAVDPAVVADLGLPARVDDVRWHLDPPSPPPDLTQREPLLREVIEAHRDRWEHGPRRLLHGDFWPGNVVWSGDAIAAVIDWENAGLGDPLSDVGITRLDLLWAFGAAAFDAFTGRYVERTGIDTADLALWDVIAALRPVGNFSVWAADWAAFGRPDLTPASMRAAHTWFVDQALAGLT